MRVKNFVRRTSVVGVVWAGVGGLMGSQASVGAPLFEGPNLFSGGLPQGLEENMTGSGSSLFLFHYHAPNGTNSFNSGSLSAGTGANHMAVGMTESLRRDSRNRASQASTGRTPFGTRVKFQDGLQGINLRQPQSVSIFDDRFLLPHPNPTHSNNQFSARTGFVNGFSLNNPPGPNGSTISPFGSSTGQAFNLTPHRMLSTGSALLEDDGLSPGSVASDGIADFVPFTAQAGLFGIPLSPRHASFTVQYIDRDDLINAGFLKSNGTENVTGISKLLPRFQLFDDGTTLVDPATAPVNENNFNHDIGNRNGGATGESLGIDRIVDGTMLLGGELANASTTIVYRETGTRTGHFVMDIDFLAEVHWDEGSLVNNFLIGVGDGTLSANWSNIPVDLGSDDTPLYTSSNVVFVDGVFVDISSTATPGNVDAGGWDFLRQQDPLAQEYDYGLTQSNNFPQPSGSSAVSFSLTFPTFPKFPSGLVQTPEPTTGSIIACALGVLGLRRQRGARH